MANLTDFNIESSNNASAFLGRGAFSQVKLVRNLKTGGLFALKEVRIPDPDWLGGPRPAERAGAQEHDPGGPATQPAQPPQHYQTQ